MKDQIENAQAIKTAALKLFSMKGFHSTSTRNICEEAGVSKGTLYWYWKSKEEIAFSLVSDMLGDFLGLIEGIRDEPGPVIDRLRRLAENIAELYYTETRHLRLLWKFRVDQDYIFNVEYIEKVTHYYVKIRKALESIIEQGVKSGELRAVNSRRMAFILLGVTEGLELQWLENENEFSMRDALPEILNMILPGLKK